MNLNSLIDYTCLKADATRETIEKLADTAMQHGFAAVCILPIWVKLAAQKLSRSPVKTCSVVAFPLGSNLSLTKAQEAEILVTFGAQEIDMVLPIGPLKERDYAYVLQDIKSVVQASAACPVKVILETCLLTDDEKITACQLAMDAGAAFVKTSTGFSKGGATLHDVALMRKTVGPTFGVKASGGISTPSFAQELIHAGANRIGTSSLLSSS